MRDGEDLAVASLNQRAPGGRRWQGGRIFLADCLLRRAEPATRSRAEPWMM